MRSTGAGCVPGRSSLQRGGGRVAQASAPTGRDEAGRGYRGRSAVPRARASRPRPRSAARSRSAPGAVTSVQDEGGKQRDRDERGSRRPPRARASHATRATPVVAKSANHATRLPDVAPGDMRQLVRRDPQDLALREASVEQRVVEDDLPRRADPGHLRVGGRRAPTRVGDLDLVDPDAQPIGRAARSASEGAVSERLEAVEERLDDERLREHDEDAERPRGRRARRSTSADRSAGEQTAPATATATITAVTSSESASSPSHAQVALLRQAVAARPPVANGRRGRPATQTSDERRPDRGAARTACSGSRNALRDDRRRTLASRRAQASTPARRRVDPTQSHRVTPR